MVKTAEQMNAERRAKKAAKKGRKGTSKVPTGFSFQDMREDARQAREQAAEKRRINNAADRLAETISRNPVILDRRAADFDDRFSLVKLAVSRHRDLTYTEAGDRVICGRIVKA